MPYPIATVHPTVARCNQLRVTVGRLTPGAHLPHPRQPPRTPVTQAPLEHGSGALPGELERGFLAQKRQGLVQQPAGGAPVQRHGTLDFASFSPSASTTSGRCG